MEFMLNQNGAFHVVYISASGELRARLLIAMTHAISQRLRYPCPEERAPLVKENEIVAHART